MDCYLCEIDFKNSGPSNEHLFPKSFGGKISKQRILCDYHNNQLGSTIDSKAFKNFKPYLLAMRLLENDNEYVEILSNNETLRLNTDFSLSIKDPVFQESVENGKKNLRIVGRNLKEFKILVEQARRKYPQIPKEYIPEQVYAPVDKGGLGYSVNYQGKDISLFIFKIFLSFLRYFIGSKNSTLYSHLIPLLLKDQKIEFVRPIILSDQEIYKEGLKGKITNNIHIFSQEENLFGFIEILGGFKYGIKIPWEQDDLSFSYFEDVFQGEIDPIQINKEIFIHSYETYNSNLVDAVKLKNSIARLLIFSTKSIEHGFIVNEAIIEAQKQCDISVNFEKFIQVLSSIYANKLINFMHGRN